MNGIITYAFKQSMYDATLRRIRRDLTYPEVKQLIRSGDYPRRVALESVQTGAIREFTYKREGSAVGKMFITYYNEDMDVYLQLVYKR